MLSPAAPPTGTAELRLLALITSAAPVTSSASAGTAASGGVCPSHSAAKTAESGTANSTASETSVGVIDRSTRLNTECPSSCASRVISAIRTQSSWAYPASGCPPTTHRASRTRLAPV